MQVVRRPGETPPPRHRSKCAQLAQLETRAGHHTCDTTAFTPGSNKSRLLMYNKLRLLIRAARA